MSRATRPSAGAAPTPSTTSTPPRSEAAPWRGAPWLGLAVAVAVVGVDQVSKWAMLSIVFSERTFIPVTGFFNLVLVRNRGASFGMFALDHPWGPWVLLAVAVVIVIVLVVWLWRTRGRWLAFTLGLIIGGAVGNLIDRARFGAVTDFLDFYIGSFHWPAFNVADSAITVGVAMLLFESLIAGRRGRKVQASE